MDSLLGWRIEGLVSQILKKGTKPSFKRLVNDEIQQSLASSTAVRVLADRVNAEFTIMPRSLVCSQLGVD